MKHVSYIVTGSALLVLSVFALCQGSDEGAKRGPDARSPVPGPAVHQRPASARAHDREATTEARPSGLRGRQKVTFERGPKRPDEHPTRYEDRTYFAEHFDEFAKRSGASEAQIQQILLALYDYQEQSMALDRDWRRAILEEDFDDPERAKEIIADDSYIQLHDALFATLQSRLARIMTWTQDRVWSDTCAHCDSRLVYYGHEDHILKLAP